MAGLSDRSAFIGHQGHFSSTLRNTLIANNRGYGIMDYDPASKLYLINCLFHGNTSGDVRVSDQAKTLTGALQIRSTLRYTSGTVDGDPKFVGGVTGAWTAAPVYNAVLNQTVLTDSKARFTPGALVGRLVAPSGKSVAQAVILANTTTTLSVCGDVSWPFPVIKGSAYRLVDDHLAAGSAAIDAGTAAGAPATDLDGKTRPVDIPGVGGDGAGKSFDIGAYEYR